MTAMHPTKRRILSVEGDKFIGEVTKDLLEQAGYEVRLASKVAEGLRRATSERFNLIIICYMLRDGMGLELCREIRQFDPHTPILLFVSADQKLELRPKVGLCVQGYLEKPLGIRDLVATVSRLLKVEQSED